MQNYLQLIQSGLQNSEQGDVSGAVVAFTSTSPGEGVSYAVQSCGAELALLTGKRTLIATSGALQDLQSMDFARMPAQCAHVLTHRPTPEGAQP